MIGGLVVMVVLASAYGNLGGLAGRMQATTEQGEWGRPVIWHDTWRMASDFLLTGVGAGAFERGMLLYQEGSRLFFFNHAHDEYLQLLAEGGLRPDHPGGDRGAHRDRADRAPAARRSLGDVLGSGRRGVRDDRGRGSERLGHGPADAGQRRPVRDHRGDRAA